MAGITSGVRDAGALAAKRELPFSAADKVVSYLAIAANGQSDSERAPFISTAQTTLDHLVRECDKVAHALAPDSGESDASEHPSPAHAAIAEFDLRARAAIDQLVTEKALPQEHLAGLAEWVSGPLASALMQLRQAQEARDRVRQDQWSAELDQSMVVLSQSLTNVENISSRIKMISLNAAVEAARLGPNGAAFAVIATSVRDLSAETESAVSCMRDTLALHKTADQ